MENFVDPYTPGGFQDRYANYFNQPTVTGGVNTTTNSSGLPGGEYYNVNPTTQTGPTATNIEFNGQLYNVADPQGLAAYNAARDAQMGYNAPQTTNQNVATTTPTAASIMAGLKDAADWKTISAQERINRVVEAANTYGLSAGDLAATSDVYTEADIAPYLVG